MLPTTGGRIARCSAGLEAAGGADAETLAVRLRGAASWRAAGRYYGLAADRQASRWPLMGGGGSIATRLIWSGRPNGARRILWRTGDALQTSVDSVEAADAYQKAAVRGDQIEQIELQRPPGLPVSRGWAHR